MSDLRFTRVPDDPKIEVARKLGTNITYKPYVLGVTGPVVFYNRSLTSSPWWSYVVYPQRTIQHTINAHVAQAADKSNR